MKLLMCVLMMFMPVSAADNFAWVVASSCCIYQNESFDEVILDGDQPLTLSHGTQLEILSDGGGDFVKVKYQDFEGYVYRYYLTFSEPLQESYPVFNGRIQNDCPIYDLDKHETEFTAKAGQQIYLYNGFNSKEEYTAVALILDNGKVYYGYVKTLHIQANGVNAALITGIMVVISCLTIIFLLLFMKKKKGSKS